MELLWITNEANSQRNTSHYVYIKDFNKLVYNKTKDREKNIFLFFSLL